ncbi:MAG: FadR family transcriptional regulator [Kiritimatiellae bacterium]|nr:FadR family transcriptional regulator [Kiritimatiellia bacterium]
MTEKAEDRFRAVSPPPRLTQEIANQIEQLIINDELHVGDALPAERDLAAKLNVSRNVLREAISMLAQKGLLQIRRGAGTFVTRPSSEFLRDTVALFIRFNRSALLDLVEARRCIEVEIAGLAAEKADAEAVALLGQHTAVMAKSPRNVAKYVDADVAFHETLAQAAGNQILSLLLSSIRGAMRENMRILLRKDPSVTETSVKHHRRLADAVRTGDVQAARTIMLEHLDDVVKRLRGLAEERSASPKRLPEAR